LPPPARPHCPPLPTRRSSDLILSGDLPPGTRLREVHLARETGVSRTPVREALRRLSAEGLAVVLPRRGAVVGQWSLADVEEIFEDRKSTRLNSSHVKISYAAL